MIKDQSLIEYFLQLVAGIELSFISKQLVVHCIQLDVSHVILSNLLHATCCI